MGIHLPPQIAALLTVVFIVFLFRRDVRENRHVTGAIWLPILWILIVCSRPVSWWLGFLGLPISGHVSAAAAVEEGSPIDAVVFFALIAAGMHVLARRQVTLGQLVLTNGWLIAFLAYCFLAVFWSDFPFVAFKRWIKVLGPPTMALVIITEPDFQTALITIIKRCAYILVLISILWIKYYQELGRGYDEWSGLPMNIGITLDKNALGRDCLILGLPLFWYFLELWRSDKSSTRRKELFLVGGLLLAISWLLSRASSSTSFATLVLGSLVIILLRIKSVRRSITLYVVIGVLVITVAEQTVGVSSAFLSFLHRNATLTDRTLLWSALLKVQINPIFGTGFESFWLGDRLKTLWSKYPTLQPNEAHNGYLETYLNLGALGLCIFIGVIIGTYRKARLSLLKNEHFARLRLGFLAAVVAYNWTEVGFRGPSALWLLFYVVAIEYPNDVGFGEVGLDADVSENEAELIYTDEELESLAFDRE